MTLGSFIVRNTFRNKRRSLLTMVSISFSLLLLTLMICIWRSFYVDQVAPEASRRLIIRDKVSLAFFLPAYYREKIRAVPGVNSVVPLTWFGGRYIDDRPEHFFAQMGTDPDEYLKVASDKITPLIWISSLVISGIVGLVSAALPSYHASQVNIVDGLRHIG